MGGLKAKVLGLLATSMLSLSAAAAPIVLNSTSQGAYKQIGIFATGGSGTSTGNYLAGWNAGDEYRNFFVFDVSSVAGSATSATLNLWNSDPNYSYGSPDASETFSLFAYAGSVVALAGGSAGVAGFADLGDGALFGSIDISAGGDVSITLNAAALNAINLSGGLLAFGGTMTTLSGTANQYVFGNTIGQRATLVVETGSQVPEPASLALVGVALALAGVTASRRRRRA